MKRSRVGLSSPQIASRAVGVAVLMMIAQEINPFLATPQEAFALVSRCRGKVVAAWSVSASSVERRMFFSMWRSWQYNKAMEYRQKGKVSICGK